MSAVENRVRNSIGGKDAAPTGKECFAISNPATAAKVLEYQGSGAEDVDRAVKAAREAFRTYAKTTPAQRQEMLLDVADLVKRERAEFARIESEDIGKPLAAAEWEVDGPINFLRYFGGAARTLTVVAAGEYFPGRQSYMRREPIGVVGVIVPYNYPLLIAACKIGPALAAGNTVVIKPPETCPRSVVKFVQLLNSVFPPGVVNLVVGGAETGRALVEHEGVDAITFTGSSNTGREIAKAAAGSMKRVSLELGGKAPVLVFEDADLERLAPTLMMGAYYNAGQDCGAATRLLVAKSAHDRVMECLVQKVRSGLVMGDLTSPHTNLGPLHTERRRTEVVQMVERRSKSAQVLIGGHIADGPGWFFQPTIITGMQLADEMTQHEVFGPVLTVETFSDEDEAIHMANSTRYGLASSLWTSDLGRALRVSSGLDFGTVWINEHHSLSPEFPWAGRKFSGIGCENGIETFQFFTQTKQVVADMSAKGAGGMFMPTMS